MCCRSSAGAGETLGKRNSGCIPLAGPLHADDFLQKFAARVPERASAGTMPIADAFRRREENFTEGANNNNAHLLPCCRPATLEMWPHAGHDSSGHEMRLRAWVECRERFQGGDCFARVDILRAPKGRLNALVALVDSHNMVQDRPTQQWQAAFMNHQQRVGGSKWNSCAAMPMPGARRLPNKAGTPTPAARCSTSNIWTARRG